MNYVLSWFDIFIYVSAFIALVAALYLEHKDLFCPEGGRCKVGNGAAYNRGKVEFTDSNREILQKIRISGRYDESSVYWRRSIVFTILLLFVFIILTQQRLPTGYEVFVGFIIIYLFTYMFLTYYQEVVSIPATKQIDESTKILSKRLSR